MKVLARMRIGAWRPGKNPPAGLCGSGAAIRPKVCRISH
jgi:hypothetical protein